MNERCLLSLFLCHLSSIPAVYIFLFSNCIRIVLNRIGKPFVDTFILDVSHCDYDIRMYRFLSKTAVMKEMGVDMNCGTEQTIIGLR